MENSFFEYRDKTEMDSDSDTEVIDSSLVVEQPFSCKKTPICKNRTVFVAESEESASDETDQDDNEPLSKLKTVVRKSSAHDQHVVLSSDDDGSKRGSIRRQSASSPNKVVLSSSDEEEVSPELVPRRKPPMRPKSIDSHSDSFIGRVKSKKRMILMDSDTENSIVIEHDKNRKLKCLKDTPLKIDGGKKVAIANSDENMSGGDESDEVSESGENEDSSDEDSNDNDENGDDDDDDGPDEDQMVMSRATRMSIMGVIPKNGDSDDDSDFIQSDDSKPNSRAASRNSFTDLPDVSTCIRKSAPKPDQEVISSPPDNDTSRITCSPFTSPLKDITNDVNNDVNTQNVSIIDLDLKENESQELRSKVLNNLAQEHSYTKPTSNDDDDDVTIIDSKPEIIALSSDDEDDVSRILIFFT